MVLLPHSKESRYPFLRKAGEIPGSQPEHTRGFAITWDCFNYLSTRDAAGIRLLRRGVYQRWMRERRE